MTPYKPVAAEIARETLLEFNKAVKARDFEKFRQFISREMAKKYTHLQLYKIFREFVDKKVDIGGIEKVEPVLAPDPKLDEKGVLHIEGIFAIEPGVVKFTLRYVYEDDKWKLAFISVKME